jgi:hypothetical protein
MYICNVNLLEMTIKELRNIINESEKGDEAFDLAKASDVFDKVRVTLEMDRDKQIYYYQITEKDLNESRLMENNIKSMLKEGWRFDDKKNIFLKNI